MWGEVREGSIIIFTVVNEDLRLPTDAKMLVGTLGWVWVGDKGNMGVGERLCSFAAMAVSVL